MMADSPAPRDAERDDFADRLARQRWAGVRGSGVPPVNQRAADAGHRHQVRHAHAWLRAINSLGYSVTPDDSFDQYRDLLGSIWLYVDWQYVTRQLTTEQKELWADAVDASGDPDEPGPKVDRWWRDDA